MRVLIIEDEKNLREQLQQQLQTDGYTVDSSGDGKDGLYIASEYPIDAAIIDLGLPGLSGLEIIRQLRQQGKTLPILILTARGRWQDKVEGLEAGADDYLVKPFQMEELQARVKALLRRATGTTDNILRCGTVTLDLTSQTVTSHNTPIQLTTFEYRLLEYLMMQRGKVVPKSELADYLYPHDEDRDSNVLEVLVGRLRRKLNPEGDLAPIETLRGRGYRFTLCDAAP
ncbi:response regulator transcription factor [Sulfurirhabdus autotrophica]|uniref:Two-component system response regulator PhoP n=1 Tax=Sulfurirhabdus autotrophica TaxID=1706046 RepID=A0A4R3XV95_9PROT|nr:response regulator transcription factor [Sulfurirhabdus autotrophica]TCV82902.1 two-component system response regulator PhoP [Sulfurirhabdus autotrophica]